MNQVSNLARIRGFFLLLFVLFCSQLCKKNNEYSKGTDENAQSSESGVISDVSNIAGGHLNSSTKLRDLGFPRGLENPKTKNLCYANSVFQFLAACFPTEIEQLEVKEGGEDALRAKLLAVIQHINSGQESSGDNDADTMLKHVDSIANSIGLHDPNHGANVYEFFKELSRRLQFLSRKKSLIYRKISYVADGEVQCEENEVEYGGMVQLRSFYDSAIHNVAAYCFRNNGLFCPYFQTDQAFSDAYGNEPLLVWDDVLKEFDLTLGQPGTALSDKIIAAYRERLLKTGIFKGLIEAELFSDLLKPLSFFYLTLKEKLPEGSKILIDNEFSQAIPEEYIRLSYGEGPNQSYQKFELIGYIHAYHPVDESGRHTTGHYAVCVRRGQQWYRIDDKSVYKTTIAGELKKLIDDDKKVQVGTESGMGEDALQVRKQTAPLLVYQASA